MKRNLSIIALLFYLALTFEAQAYTFTDDFNRGFYWKNFPISMNKFVLKVSDGVLLSAIVQECELEWEAAIGMPIWNIPIDSIASSKYSGNNIRWADDFAAETGFDPSTTLAVTIRYQTGTYVTKTEIILNGEQGNLAGNQSMLYKVVLHEMGHTIGLGHTENYGIMRATINYAANGLTADDIAGAEAVIEETIWRQDNHFISPNATEETSTCGTVDFGDQTSGGGPGSFILSFGLGALLIAFIRRNGSYLSHLVRY